MAGVAGTRVRIHDIAALGQKSVAIPTESLTNLTKFTWSKRKTQMSEEDSNKTKLRTTIYCITDFIGVPPLKEFNKS